MFKCIQLCCRLSAYFFYEEFFLVGLEKKNTKKPVQIFKPLYAYEVAASTMAYPDPSSAVNRFLCY